MDPKYIVVDFDFGGPQMFIFPNMMDHKKFFNSIKVSENDKVLSAGFISKQTPFKAMACYGSSFSLGLESRPEEDNKLLKRLLFGFC